MSSKFSLVKLSGTALTILGEEKKHNFFSFMDYDMHDYSDVFYTEEEANKVRMSLQHLSTGASAVIPLICGGAKICPVAQSCPFVQLEKERKAADATAKSPVPLGKQCQVEKNLLNEWTRIYIREYSIDEGNFTDFQMVRELSEIEVMLWRLNNNLAKPENAMMTQETVVGVSKQGDALVRQEISSIFEAKERLLTRKMKLIKLLVGDRQEKYKRAAALKVQDETDSSISSSQLRHKIEKLTKETKAHELKLKEAEGNIIDVESVCTPDDLISEG